MGGAGAGCWEVFGKVLGRGSPKYDCDDCGMVVEGYKVEIPDSSV